MSAIGTALQSGILLLIAAFALLSSRYGYSLNLRMFAKRQMKRFGYKSLKDLKFSFDRMIYAIPLPTNQPSIKQAKMESYRIVEDFDSWIYPQLNGIRVLLTPKQGEELLIAYVSTEQFRMPSLDQLLIEGKINRTTYRRISATKLTMLSTKTEIIEEVYSQIQNKRFS
ncbi:hypothetical protein K0T92_16665 [Paenibacillus oenotherae]|uniref:DUF2726 domain-containing protein n=1 Tax=Paenibacillus oenotherae TaxID=1435645 RepID=A0ABS7D9D3_9BACL|nr:hypothetical protein [Paenibacillus oenotherae]MBW7476368.1 hypothetical protein [Paenibacillus oenotherae]